MIGILETNPAIGAISDLELQLGDGKGVKSGELSRWQGIMLMHGSRLFKVKIPVDRWTWSSAGGRRYATADFVRNFLLIRREVFAEVLWNENLRFQGEHEAFMLEVKKAGWLIAFTPESIHQHDETHIPVPSDPAAGKRGTGFEEMKKEFKSAYGVQGIESVNIDKYLPRTKRSSPARRTAREIVRFLRRVCGKR